MSKVFRLLEPIVRRPTRTAGVAVALAIALCIARSPSLVVPTFRELDYFEQTDIIFHLYSSIPSVLLFGDLDAINAVKGLYNLDLKIGEAKQDQHFDIASLPLSPPPSAYNTEANYVQEHIFIQDLIDATEHFFRQGSLSLTTSFLHPDDDTSAEQRQIHSASVEALRLRLRQALSRFQAEHDMLMSQVRLTGYNSMEAVSSHARARNAKLSKMQMAMDSPSKGYGGTDEARLACLWDELGNSENPATNALCDHTPRTHLEFALGQVNNVTVQGLLAIVMCHVVHFPGADARCDGITQPPSDDFSSFIPLYQERVQNLITELRQFVDQLRQTRREVYGSDPHPSHPCVTSQPSRLCVRNCSLREAEIMAEFLEDIAIPRLEYMEGNAAISTQIFSDAERRRRSVFDQVWPMANRYEQHGVIDWLKLSWPDFKLPVFPSLNALTNESNSARDRLNLMHDKFKACVHYVEQFDESSYKVNDVEKWFSNCTLECKPQYNPMLLSEDVSAEEIDAFLLNGTGLDMAASNESPRPSRWWEALFPWLIDQ